MHILNQNSKLLHLKVKKLKRESFNLCEGRIKGKRKEPLNEMRGRGSRRREKEESLGTFGDILTFLPIVLSSTQAAVNHDFLIPSTH